MCENVKTAYNKIQKKYQQLISPNIKNLDP